MQEESNERRKEQGQGEGRKEEARGESDPDSRRTSEIDQKAHSFGTRGNYNNNRNDKK